MDKRILDYTGKHIAVLCWYRSSRVCFGIGVDFRNAELFAQFLFFDIVISFY